MSQVRALLAFALMASACALAAPPDDARAGPLDPYRKIFGPPVETLKRALDRDRDPSLPSASAVEAPAPEAEEGAPGPIAAEATAVAEESDATVDAAVPDPRPRPEPEAEIAAALPTADAQGVVESEAAGAAEAPAVAVADFDARFQPDPGPLAKPVLDVPTPRVRADAAGGLGPVKLASLPSGRAVDGPAPADCVRSLSALGVVSVQVDPIRDGKCGIAAPTAVSALGGGGITLSEKAVLNCRAAETIGKWMRDDVEPVARQHLGGSVTGIRVAASYHCRGRNGDPDAKLSEHSFGNAIDISAFQVAGVGWVEVGGPKGLSARRFLSDVRKSACGPFTTVLGPGSDAHHSDHLHLDVIRRGKNGNSLYCK